MCPVPGSEHNVISTPAMHWLYVSQYSIDMLDEPVQPSMFFHNSSVPLAPGEYQPVEPVLPPS
jgi:hypothetical protein